MARAPPPRPGGDTHPDTHPAARPASRPRGRTGTSVGARLTRAHGVVVVLLLLVGVSGAGGLLVTGASRAHETQLRRLEAANTALQLTTAEADAALRDYRDTLRPDHLEAYRQSVRTLPALRGDVESLLTDPLQRSLFDEQTRLAEVWLAGTDPDRGAAVVAAATAEADAFDALHEANERLDVLVRHQRDEATSAEDRARTGALVVTALTLAAALAVVVTTGVRTRHALVDPLRALVDVLDALRTAPGGRAQRATPVADPTRGPGEVRAVALALNDLARENRRLLQAAEQSAHLHRLAGDIGRQVRDQLVADDALQVAVTRLGEELDVARVRVRLLTGSGVTPIAQQWARPPLAPLDAPGPGGTAVPGDPSGAPGAAEWLRRLHAGGEVHAVPGTTPSEVPRELLDDLPGARAGAALLVPIGVGEAPHGLLTLVGARARDWSVPEVELARSVAVDLARALVLAGLYRAQERLLGELREVESVKSDLLATVSHELRTPLTSIAGYLELLRDGALGEVPEDVAAVLGIVERNTDRLRSLIEDLLLLSRVEPLAAGPGAPVRTTTTVADLVAGVARTVQGGATRGGTLRCTTPPADLTGLRTRGDAEHLHRAVLAVVDNAVKFSPVGSLVRLRVENHPGRVRIVVQDNGMGIPAGETDAVFARFARGSNATALAVPGAGLGLTIARDLVRLHGGSLDLESVEGQGTTARLELPLLEDRDPARTGGAP